MDTSKEVARQRLLLDGSFNILVSGKFRFNSLFDACTCSSSGLSGGLLFAEKLLLPSSSWSIIMVEVVVDLSYTKRRGDVDDESNVTPSNDRDLALLRSFLLLLFPSLFSLELSGVPPPSSSSCSSPSSFCIPCSNACLLFNASTASFSRSISCAYRSPTSNAVFLSDPARFVVYASTRPYMTRQELGVEDVVPLLL